MPLNANQTELAEIYGVNVATICRLMNSGAPVKCPDSLLEWLEDNRQRRGALWSILIHPRERAQIAKLINQPRCDEPKL